jgi:hypothetical protein
MRFYIDEKEKKKKKGIKWIWNNLNPIY